MKRNILKRMVLCVLICALTAGMCIPAFAEENEDTPISYEYGWYEIDGSYYFYMDGEIQKGWISYNNRTYYTDAETGKMAEGFQKIGENWYYFKTEGSGKMLTGFQKIGGSWYYFDSKGVMLTGFQKIGSNWYYFKGGDSGKMLTGFQKINGYWYYFKTGDSGKMLTGFQKIGSNWYYFKGGDSGRMLTGWQTIGANKYYFKGGDSGKMLTGWQKIDGSWYYFKGGNSGKMLTGWQKIDGNWFFFFSNGKTAMGWQKVGSSWYYFKEGNSGKMMTGWIRQNGSWYYMNSDGKMQTGWVKSKNNWYYMNPENGKMVTKTVKIDGVNMQFNADGICQNLNSQTAEYKMKVYAQNYYSDTQWLMMVDLTNNITGVYKGSNGNWKQIYSWQCSTGTAEEPTPDGEFKINSNRGYCFGSDHYTCYYYSSFNGPYLFHSGLYYANTFDPQDIRLGIRASAGCIRLDINNAKWVLDNIPLDTKVVTYY